MILARTLTLRLFLQEFPPGGTGHGPILHSSHGSRESQLWPLPPLPRLLEYVSKCPRPFLTYKDNVLNEYRGDNIW